jgi:hypothetical protein
MHFYDFNLVFGVFAKAEALTVTLAESKKPTVWLNFIAGVIGILASMLTLGLRNYKDVFTAVSDTVNVVENVIVKLTRKRN